MNDSVIRRLKYVFVRESFVKVSKLPSKRSFDHMNNSIPTY